MAPAKLVPVMVTVVPAVPLAGVKLAITGPEAAVTVKLVELAADPCAEMTAMGPLVAPAGTAAEICEAESTVKVALDPLNSTEEVPVKLEPEMTTRVPAGPLAGAKPAMIGDELAVTVKLRVLIAVPERVVTEMEPVVAIWGTTAWS